MIQRIDLTTGTFWQEPLPSEWQGLGGRALTSNIVGREVPARCWPLGPENKLVLAPGLLAGTTISSSGRLSVGAKSPLTGGIKESNVGGLPGAKLARLGIQALVVEGAGATGRWQVLELGPAGPRLVEAQDLTRTGTYETVTLLRERYGPQVACLVAGPAGEMGLSAAAVCVTDQNGVPARHAARGGLGAVMGAKRLKAIVVDDSGSASRPLADPKGYWAALRRYHEALQAHPVTGKSLPIYGTNGLVATIDTLGGLPTHNFSQGSFALSSQIGGDALHDLIVERGAETTHACMPGCIIRCSNTFLDSEGEELTRGLEYESIVMLGANCGIGNLDALARLNRRCDELGLDTIEMGVAIGVAMEAGLLAFGDSQAALTLLDEVGQGTALGRILGQGAAVTGRVFNVRRVPVVKGQAISAYDPRAIKGTGVTYATSPQGADHTAGNCLPGSRLPDGTKPDVHRREYQVALSRYVQELSMAFDSLGLCWFARQPILKNPLLLTDLLAAVRGGEWTMDGLLAAGRAALQVELDFNRAAGFTPADDRLPDFYAEEPLSPLHLTFDLSPEELQEAVAGP